MLPQEIIDQKFIVTDLNTCILNKNKEGIEKLYDPKKPEGQQWLYEQQFFKNSFSIVHFGIGHAF